VGWAGYVTRTGQERNVLVHRIVVVTSERKDPLKRPKSAWVDNNKMDLGEIGGGVCIGLVWLRIGTSGWLLNLRFS
jgi:hypothetical protein